ncbi:MAG: glycoside hydrolase family 20 zincin-like fold domain-containing protein, partial [Bacteroidales bacterium]
MRLHTISLSAISVFLFLNSIHAAEIRVFPEPEHIEFTTERFNLDESVIITFNGSETGIQQVAQHLSQEMAARFQVPLGWKNSIEANTDQKTIFLGLLSDPGISDVFNRSGVKPDPGLNRPEGYQLVVTSSAVIVAGSDISGLFYGIQSLFQLVDYQGRGEGFQGRASIRGVLISDKPFKPFRGIHVYLPARDDIPFFKKFIKLLAGYKVNTLIIEVGGGMRLDQHPEINIAWEHFTQSMYDMGDTNLKYGEQTPLGHDNRFQASTHTELAGGSWLTKEEVRDIVDFARAYHMEVIPEIQGLSHAYYLTLAHRDIADPPGTEWPDSYDPSNPKSYKLLFDVMDEYLEVFQPDWVHIGHDEWRARVMSEPGNGEVFARDVLKINQYLNSRGVKTMMWADHLIRGHNLEGHGPDRRPEDEYVWYSWPSTVGAPEMIAAEAKDILMMNWSWEVTGTAISQLKNKGWNQVLGNFQGHTKYDQWVSLLSDSTILGAETSTWCGATEKLYGLNNIIMNMLVSQQILWSGKTTPLDEIYQHLAQAMPGIRYQVSGRKLPSMDMRDGRKGYEWVPLKLPSKKGSIAPAYPVSVPDSIEPVRIPVNSNAASILFLHVSSGRADKLPVESTHYFQDKAEWIGSYMIHYAD